MKGNKRRYVTVVTVKNSRFSDFKNVIRKLILYILYIIYIVLKYLTLLFEETESRFFDFCYCNNCNVTGDCLFLISIDAKRFNFLSGWIPSILNKWAFPCFRDVPEKTALQLLHNSNGIHIFAILK